MTAYAGDIIQLQPKNAAIYDVKVKRVISEGQEGVAGEYLFALKQYSTTDGITAVAVSNQVNPTYPRLFRNLSNENTTKSNTITKVVTELNHAGGLYDLYTWSRDTTTSQSEDLLKAVENPDYYGIGFPNINFVNSDRSKYFGLYAHSFTAGKAAIPAEVEYIESPNTFVDRMGKLHIDKNLSSGDVIEVTIKSTYINPSDETEEFEEVVEITLD